MSKISFGETRRRGDVIETVIHDTTRIGNPPAASILTMDDEFVIVPTNPQMPIEKRDNFNAAVNFIEQLIPDE